METVRKVVQGSVLAAVMVGALVGVVIGGGTAHAETRGCSSEQYIAWFNSRPPKISDTAPYYDAEAFAAWWDARYCG